MTYSIELDNCSIAFTHSAGQLREVLTSVSLTISPGEFVVLIGPSGCGKTTVLNTVAGFVPVSDGTVKVNGRMPDPASGKVGYILQEYALFPWRTVYQNIAFGLEIRGVALSERKERIDHYLRMMKLSNYAHHYPRQLSGGMKQRVAIARTLVVDPAILLMDEPFGALDAQTREELQDELLRIHVQTGKTIIFVTHSIEEGVYLGNRVVVLRGSPSTIVRVLETNRPPSDREFRVADQFFRSCKLLREALADGR